jgi:2,3-bisphosphoglycerate-dependent phosphoglycerate mutase
MKYLDDMPDAHIVELNIPTARLLVYELDDDLMSIRQFYLGDETTIKTSIAALANQGKAAA